jgi:tetratricopeptide (TPR) repeat protein
VRPEDQKRLQEIVFRSQPIRRVTLAKFGEEEKARHKKSWDKLEAEANAFLNIEQRQEQFYETHIGKVGHPLRNRLSAKSDRFSNVSNFTLDKPSCVIKGGEISTEINPTLLDALTGNIVKVQAGIKHVLQFRHLNDPNPHGSDDEDAMQALIEVDALQMGKSYEIGQGGVKAIFASKGYGARRDYFSDKAQGQVKILTANEIAVVGTIAVSFNFRNGGTFTLEGDFELPLIENQEIANFKKDLNSNVLAEPQTFHPSAKTQQLNDQRAEVLKTPADNLASSFPEPKLRVVGTEDYDENGQKWTRYWLTVDNLSEYPDDLFEVSEHLSPLAGCKGSAHISRTFVGVHAASGEEIMGFCSLGSPEDLGRLWFAVSRGQNPPEAIYVSLTDRRNNVIRLSNKAVTKINKQVAELQLQRPTTPEREQQKTQRAETLKESLRVAEGKVGPSHPDLLEPLLNLAQWYSRERKYAEAEAYYQRILEVEEKRDDPDRLISALHDVAFMKEIQRKYAEAEPLRLRIMDIAENILKSDQIIETHRHHLAVLYDNWGKYDKAAELFQRNLKVSERVRGPNDERVGLDAFHVAVAYTNGGRYAQSVPFFKRALAIEETVYGSETWQVANTLSWYATALAQLGKKSEAKSLLQRAIRIAEKDSGPNKAFAPSLQQRLEQLSDAKEKVR